jgi:hypothetical protein
MYNGDEFLYSQCYEISDIVNHMGGGRLIIRRQLDLSLAQRDRGD